MSRLLHFLHHTFTIVLIILLTSLYYLELIAKHLKDHCWDMYQLVGFSDGRSRDCL